MGWSAFGKGLAAGIIGEAGRQVESNELRVNKLIDDQTKAYGKRVEEAKLTRKEENKRNRIILQGFKIRFSDTPNGLRRGAWYLKEFGPEAAEAFLEKADLALKQGTPYTDFLKWAPAGTDTTVRSLDDYTNSLSTPWDLPAFGQTQAALSGREQMPWWGKGQYDASLLAATPSIDDFKRDESIIIDAEEGSGPQFSLLQSDADTRELNRTAKEKLHNIIADGPGELGSQQSKDYAAAVAALTAINKAGQTPSPGAKGFTSSDRNALAVLENSLKRNWSETAVGALGEKVAIRANGITTTYNINTQAKELAEAREQFVIGYKNAVRALIDKTPDLFSEAGLGALLTLFPTTLGEKPDTAPKGTGAQDAAPMSEAEIQRRKDDKVKVDKQTLKILYELVAAAERGGESEIVVNGQTMSLRDAKEMIASLETSVDYGEGKKQPEEKSPSGALGEAPPVIIPFNEKAEGFVRTWMTEKTPWGKIEGILKAWGYVSEDVLKTAERLVKELQTHYRTNPNKPGQRKATFFKLIEIMRGNYTSGEADSAPQAQSDNDKGVSAYETGNDAEAVKRYRKEAEQGDADAQWNLGWHYENGWGVTQDDAEAVKWFRKAAEQGNAQAQRWLKVSGYALK